MKPFARPRVIALVGGFCLCLAVSGPASAYTITLVPSASMPDAGTQVSFDLVMDFTGEPTVGGGIDIVYGGFTDGNGLRFAGYAPAATAAEYTSPDGLVPVAQSGMLMDLAFGYPLASANFGADLPFDPAITVGTLTFDVLSAGTYTLSAAETSDPNGTAGFYSSANGNKLSLVNVPVSIQAQGQQAVPAPGTAWLLLGGGGALWASRRRRA